MRAHRQPSATHEPEERSVFFQHHNIRDQLVLAACVRTEEVSLRECHITARLQGDFYDRGALDLRLLTGRGVSSRHLAGLIEPVGLHSPGVAGHKHLQHHRLIHAFQLEGRLQTQKWSKVTA